MGSANWRGSVVGIVITVGPPQPDRSEQAITKSGIGGGIFDGGWGM